MGYLANDELQRIGFKKLGRAVKISDKAIIYNAERISVGDFSRIDDLCILSGRLTIGRNVHISVFCNIAGGEPGIVLEDFCGISYGSHIFSQSDDYSGLALTGPTVPLPYRREKKAAVTIGRHVIVGAGSIVMPGVTVSEGGSIGAMSLVTKTTLPWSIYVGAPARRIGERKKDMLKLEALYLKESE